jgi:glycosyltransferase involved in cell wall biosynthesis
METSTTPQRPFRQRRILLINSFMSAGGAQQATLRLGRQLRLRGHEAEVCFLYNRGGFYDPEVVGVATRTLIDRPRISALDALRLPLRLHRLIRAERPDAVIGFLPLAAVLGASAALAAGVKVRMASQRVPGSTFGGLMRRLDRLCGSLGVYSRVVCVSNAVRDSFSGYPRRYRERLTVVHNGIEWTPLEQSKAAAREAIGLPSDAVVLLAVGRLEPQKNLPFLVEQIAAVPGVVLLIAGEGAQRAQLERRIRELGLQDRVTLMGNLGRNEVRRLLAAADVFVQPSLFEGQSNALLEAMHAGLPPLVSDVPMQRETLTDDAGGTAGFIIPLDDPAAWREALLRMRDDIGLRQEHGRRAAALVEARFGLQRMVDAFEAAIQ